jgi:hypothetical protein
LNWSGSLTAPVREIDAARSATGLQPSCSSASWKKLKHRNERSRAASARSMLSGRRSGRVKAAEEEALRQAQARAEAERARRDAERLQSEQQRQPEDPKLG